MRLIASVQGLRFNLLLDADPQQREAASPQSLQPGQRQR